MTAGAHCLNPASFPRTPGPAGQRPRCFLNSPAHCQLHTNFFTLFLHPPSFWYSLPSCVLLSKALNSACLPWPSLTPVPHSFSDHHIHVSLRSTLWFILEMLFFFLCVCVSKVVGFSFVLHEMKFWSFHWGSWVTDASYLGWIWIES